MSSETKWLKPGCLWKRCRRGPKRVLRPGRTEGKKE
jgi:hypothetical protein